MGAANRSAEAKLLKGWHNLPGFTHILHTGVDYYVLPW
jgi:hypothetical protein